MKIDKLQVFGWENAILGMRFPKNSENYSDSIFNSPFILGDKDKKLLLALCKAGKDHRKVLRMIHIQASILMPISWWVQYDTYKIGTTANSRSRMHKMGDNLLTLDDFYFENTEDSLEYFTNLIEIINKNIIIYQNNKNSAIAKKAWRFIIDILPMSFQQERMVDLNYEVLLTIIQARYTEKLNKEWQFFCDYFLEYCPYLKDILDALKDKK